MCFICIKNIYVGAFFRNKMSIRVSLSSYKIRKIFSLVDIYSIYELLHWQVYRNGLKL